MSEPAEFKRRSGLQHVPFMRRSVWKRLAMWWRGDPHVVSQMITYGQPQCLYVGTDKGLFYMDEKSQVLKPVPLVVSNQSKNQKGS